nr:MAG TPA: hypothetical protein [Caudoviricetes sp.]
MSFGNTKTPLKPTGKAKNLLPIKNKTIWIRQS